ncbi:MAG: class I SAM-dependent methyltransferase [Acidimicrobiales bacterium]
MVPNQPSRTAEVVCLFRAVEQRRPPNARIVDDPYAELFLGRGARRWMATWRTSGRLGDFVARHSSGLASWVLTRHRFMDDRLVSALDRGVAQVVILGAGYDTRAYRFHDRLAGRPVFEVDFPATSRRKVEIIAREGDRFPAANVHRVEIDFEVDSLADRLAGAGFESGAGTFFVWEGVSMYLTRQAVQGTLSTVHKLSGPGSGIVLDLWHLIDTPDLLSTARRASVSFIALIGEPITFGLHPDDAVPFLERLGYEVDEVADADALAARYVHDGRLLGKAWYVVAAHPRFE